MEPLSPNPTDQQVYDSGLGTRQAYQRAFHKQERLKRDTERIIANTVVTESRSSARFNGAVDPAIEQALTKNRLAASVKAKQEEKLRVAYAEFVAFGGWETAQGRNAGAKLATLLGYTRETVPNNFGLWLSGDEAKQRFMKGWE